MRNALAFLLGFTLVIGVNGTLSSCGNSGGGSSGGSIAAPSPGQWVVFGGNVSVNGNGSFTFGTAGAPGQGVGYVYTGYNGNAAGKIITMTYTVSGTGTVVPSAASGSGPAQVRLFVWRKGDDLQCTATTEWYRQWSATGVGPLTIGQHTITAVISDPGWTDCYAKTDAGQLAGVAANLLGIGFTFGAEFFGHGVYSTGQNTFTLNSFTVQ